MSVNPAMTGHAVSVYSQKDLDPNRKIYKYLESGYGSKYTAGSHNKKKGKEKILLIRDSIVRETWHVV